MATKKALKVPRYAEYQVVLQGLAGGTVILLVRDPRTGKLKIKKIPDPRLRLTAVLRTLAAAGDLDSSLAADVAEAMQPALERLLP